MRKIGYFAIAAGVGCLSVGCAAGGTGAGTAKAVPIVTYQCAEKIIRTQVPPGTNFIKLTLPEGREVQLNAVDGSSGTKFSDGTITFVVKGKEASVEFASGGRKPITGCVAK